MIGNERLCKRAYYDLKSVIEEIEGIPCAEKDKDQQKKTLDTLNEIMMEYEKKYYEMMRVGRMIDFDLTTKLSDKEIKEFLDRYKEIKFFYRNKFSQVVQTYFHGDLLAFFRLISPENYKVIRDTNYRDVLCYWDPVSQAIRPWNVNEVLKYERDNNADDLYRAILTDKTVVEKLGYDEERVKRLMAILCLFDTKQTDTAGDTI